MSGIDKAVVWTGGLIAVLLLLFVLEASGGHDGYLCEWGYDKDGDGEGVTCG